MNFIYTNLYIIFPPIYKNRKFFSLLILVPLIIASCKKEKQTVQIKVNDQVTNTPVNGARVTVYKCGTFNCYFGSLDLFTGTTDKNGICNIPSDNYNEAVFARVEKIDYWSFDETKANLKTIVPAGWIRLRILKTPGYPEGASLNISVTSQLTNSSGSALNINNIYHAAADSSILIKAFGGQINKIEWQVNGAGTAGKQGSWNQQVPRLDTVNNITLNY